MKRGVSLYSYQQTQFFKQLDLEGQLKEVAENLNGASGIELLDEMSLSYPDPSPAFFDRWSGWIQEYGVTPVAMDVFWDVLQFRDHVMSYHEGAQRLEHDVRLAKKLGFRIVRVLPTQPLEVMTEVLPVAEELDIRLGKEIHQPLSLRGPEVREIVDYVGRTGTRHLGILLDCGVFQFRPCDPLLAWYFRHGAKKETCDLVVRLALEVHRGEDNPLQAVDTSSHTAGNVRSEFTRFLHTGAAQPDLREAFLLMKRLVDDHVRDPGEIDYTVIAEALTFSRPTAKELADIVPFLTHVHGKFYDMTEIPGHAGTYQDVCIDYETVIATLRESGFDGYINSEYEGQRFFQDRGTEELADEVEQVRHHQEMLRRLIGA